MYSWPCAYSVPTCAKFPLAPDHPECNCCLRRGVPVSAKITCIFWPTGWNMHRNCPWYCVRFPFFFICDDTPLIEWFLTTPEWYSSRCQRRTFLAWFQVSAAVWMRHSLFWGVTHRIFVGTDVSGQPFGPIFKSQAIYSGVKQYLQESSNIFKDQAISSRVKQYLQGSSSIFEYRAISSRDKQHL